MSTAVDNRAWQLEDFVDSLVVDLDKTRETLAVKAINKPLSYTVKEVALDLNIFPSLRRRPGEVRDGAARAGGRVEGDDPARLDHRSAGSRDVEGSLGQRGLDRRDRRRPRDQEDAAAARRELRRGPQADRGEERGPQEGQRQRDRLRQAGEPDQESAARTDPPRITGVNLSIDEDRMPSLVVQGEHLAVDPLFAPVAVVNERLAEVMSSSDSRAPHPSSTTTRA